MIPITDQVREQLDQRQPLRQPDPGRPSPAGAREALHHEDAEGHRQGPAGEEGLCPQVQGQQPGKWASFEKIVWV